MLLTDFWLPVYKQEQSLWIDLDTRLCHFEKLLKRIPLAETQKLKLIQETVKEKSGYFACLVNRNIDLLLLSEFFETKKSRNILLNRETDRYMKVFNGYSMSGKTNLTAVYPYLDTPEELSKAPSGTDLFSGYITAKTDTVLSDSQKELLSALETFTGSQADMPFIFKSLVVVWELIKASGGFDNNREALHYLNYCFDAEGLKCYKLLNIEKGLAEHRALDHTKDPAAWALLLHDIVLQELEQNVALLKTLFRQEIGYEQMKVSQKIASNYLFDNGFDTALHNIKATDAEQKLLRMALKTGTIYPSEITKLFHIGKQAGEAQNLLNSGYFIPDVTGNDEPIWVISTSHFQPHYLSVYNNIPLIAAVMPVISEPTMVAEPVMAINESIETELKAPVSPVRKAFFG